MICLFLDQIQVSDNGQITDKRAAFRRNDWWSAEFLCHLCGHTFGARAFSFIRMSFRSTWSFENMWILFHFKNDSLFHFMKECVVCRELTTDEHLLSASCCCWRKKSADFYFRVAFRLCKIGKRHMDSIKLTHVSFEARISCGQSVPFLPHRQQTSPIGCALGLEGCSPRVCQGITHQAFGTKKQTKRQKCLPWYRCKMVSCPAIEKWHHCVAIFSRCFHQFIFGHFPPPPLFLGRARRSRGVTSALASLSSSLDSLSTEH